MQKNIEVELKFQILNKQQLKNFLASLKLKKENVINDVYLDTKEAYLYKKGIFIRIRNNSKLDFKFNPDDWKDPKAFSDHSHCNEYSFDLPLKQSSTKNLNEVCNILNLHNIQKADLDELRSKNNLIESVIINKTRREYRDNDFSYDYDTVKNLGEFFEIEKLTSIPEEIESIKESMRKKLNGLNLKLITTGYNELYWRKHNFEIYLQGRFLLMEDYKKYRVNS